MDDKPNTAGEFYDHLRSNNSINMQRDMFIEAALDWAENWAANEGKMTPELAHAIKVEVTLKYDSSRAFCEAHPQYSPSEISGMINCKYDKITPKVRVACELLAINIKHYVRHVTRQETRD